MGKVQASSGMLRFYGSWELVNKGTQNSGAFICKIEHRHKSGAIPPKALGFENVLAKQIYLILRNHFTPNEFAEFLMDEKAGKDRRSLNFSKIQEKVIWLLSPAIDQDRYPAKEQFPSLRSSEHEPEFISSL